MRAAFRNLLLLILYHEITTCPAIGQPTQQWAFATTRLWEEDDKRFDFTTHVRLESLEEQPILYQLQPRFSLSCGKYFRCATNYSFFALNSRTATGEETTEHQNRFEAELNPFFKFSDTWSYNGRNRLEYLIDSDFDYINSRIRHRDAIEHLNPFGLPIKLFTSNEIFFSRLELSFNQNRFIPLGLRVPWNDTEISIYPMILTNKRDGDWNNIFVLGLDLFLDPF
jgi:hypothetical protein